MPWNPEVYNKFKNVRNQPFFDLAEFISPENMQTAIDLGCGTGEQTALLSERFKQAVFLGIDASEEMLSKSKIFQNEKLRFEKLTTEEMIASGQKWDLVFSNAALQWSDDHEKLFPELIGLVNENGQFAVQMPVQPDNILNQILLELAQEEPYSGFLSGWKRESPLLCMDDYAQIMFDGGLQDLQIIQKVYPIVADNHQTLYEFISGSALIPYIEKLQAAERALFIAEFKKRISAKFPKLPCIYAFKRLLLYGRKLK